MGKVPNRYLLDFARALHAARDWESLLSLTLEEVRSRTPYRSAWLYILEDDGKTLRLLGAFGSGAELVNEQMQTLAVQGDAMIQEILAAREPVVVVDARSDPRTDKKIVAMLGNRTIVNVPLLLEERRVGSVGVGTFGDEEGVRPPTADELEYLRAMASHISSAAGRLQAEARGRELERQLQRSHRLEALGRLAGGIAHDFNNLLVVILGSADLATEELGDHPATRWLEEIRGTAVRAARLTRQLLAFSRSQIIEKQALDLRDLVRDLMSMLRRLLPSNIRIELSEVAEPCIVLADAGQLEQLLLNLVVNARDAMPAGGKIVVELAPARDDDPTRPSGHVRLSVSDTGEGVPPELLERVFEPFFTTRQDEGGTGLGLAVVKSIVDQHGARVSVTSQRHAGTTFHVDLPAGAGLPEARSAAPGPRLESGDERLLVVEDDSRVRRVVEHVLRRSGYEVVSAPDGVQALDLLESRGPAIDLVVSDVVMPHMNGFELRDAMRERGLRMPILFTTGYTPKALAALGEASEDHQLRKPFRPRDLLRKVREVLDGARGD